MQVYANNEYWYILPATHLNLFNVSIHLQKSFQVDLSTYLVLPFPQNTTLSPPDKAERTIILI